MKYFTVDKESQAQNNGCEAACRPMEFQDRRQN